MCIASPVCNWLRYNVQVIVKGILDHFSNRLSDRSCHELHELSRIVLIRVFRKLDLSATRFKKPSHRYPRRKAPPQALPWASLLLSGLVDENLPALLRWDNGEKFEHDFRPIAVY